MGRRAKSAGASSTVSLPLAKLDEARGRWRSQLKADLGDAKNPKNRSGVAIKPLYTPQDWDGARYLQALGFPGQAPMTRGIYASMHRGRTWTQRQLIGLGVPEDYNVRLKTILGHGGTAVSLIPCNSVYRGYDIDAVPPEILGTCGVTVNSVLPGPTRSEGVERFVPDLAKGQGTDAARVEAEFFRTARR